MFENLFLDTKLSKLVASKGDIGDIETFLEKHPTKRKYDVLIELAIVHDNIDFLKYLSKSDKFDVNHYIDTGYHAYLAELAIMIDSPDALEFLLSKGADISLYNEYSDPGESLLESVVRNYRTYKNCTKILKILIKYHEHVTHRAIKAARNNPEILTLLEQAKQDQSINGYKKSSIDIQREESL